MENKNLAFGNILFMFPGIHIDENKLTYCRMEFVIL